MTVVKICGLTRLDDAVAAVQAGADLLGFVLVESSPRYVTPAQAKDIVAALRQQGITVPCVGVVADLSLAQIRAIKDSCGFALMQLHGHESPDLAMALYPQAIVARQITGEESLRLLAKYMAFAYLLDARGNDRRSAQPGTWDWRLLVEMPVRGRVFVAGGLRPDNVAIAIRRARPYGVDVASGVETAPGRKDWQAVARFIKNVREVDNEDGYL